MTRKRLSAIEHTVLGIAWKRGPCTTYGLMKELASSTSTYYKAKAGTAYPLVDRLLREGLLEQAEGTGTRGEKLIAITDAGIELLKSWLTDPIDLTEVAHTVDFVRLRVFYLGAASPEERLRMLDCALQRLNEQLAICEDAVRRYEAIGDVFSSMATSGVIAETLARIEWLTKIQDRAVALPVGRPAP